MELGKQIKMHRQEAELSQEELANRVYVSRQTILNWENDKSYPDVNSLVLLSEIFQISLDKLIKGDIGVMKEVIQKEEIEKNETLRKNLHYNVDCDCCFCGSAIYVAWCLCINWLSDARLFELIVILRFKIQKVNSKMRLYTAANSIAKKYD